MARARATKAASHGAGVGAGRVDLMLERCGREGIGLVGVGGGPRIQGLQEGLATVGQPATEELTERAVLGGRGLLTSGGGLLAAPEPERLAEATLEPRQTGLAVVRGEGLGEVEPHAGQLGATALGATEELARLRGVAGLGGLEGLLDGRSGSRRVVLPARLALRTLTVAARRCGDDAGAFSPSARSRDFAAPTSAPDATGVVWQREISDRASWTALSSLPIAFCRLAIAQAASRWPGMSVRLRARQTPISARSAWRAPSSVAACTAGFHLSKGIAAPGRS
ncbi:MAG: hypothetical protein H6736_06245 [Alphaproteobacteria bacterium]|nr:hypothetical protein [Alphaproteobacteria bacterium]